LQNRKNRVPNKVLIGIITCGVLALLVFNIVYNVLDRETTYNVTSNGLSTFSIFNGNFTFIVDNNPSMTKKVMKVYALDSNTQITISASDLVEDTSGKHIDSKKILFNDTSLFKIENIGIYTPKTVTISINYISNQTGSYHGSIFIMDEKKTSVPVTVDIKPTFNRVIIWVINGIALAIVFWKIIKYYNEKHEKGDDPVMDKNVYKNLGFSDRSLETRKITWGTIGKNAILDLGSITFGMVVGVFGLSNNTYITGVHFLDIPGIIVLIGIGMGIGSLKEYTHVASEPENPKT
jgi:hypothetical protein